MSTPSVARDLLTIASRATWARACWRQVPAQWGDCKQSRIMPLDPIVIIIMSLEERRTWTQKTGYTPKSQQQADQLVQFGPLRQYIIYRFM